MQTPDRKIIHLELYTGTNPAANAVEQGHGNEDVVGRLLRKMESDVAELIARASPDEPTKTPVAANTAALLADQDDEQPLPRLFTGRDGENHDSENQRQEDMAEYKSAAFRGFCVGIFLIVPIIVWITFSLLPGAPASDASDKPAPAAVILSPPPSALLSPAAVETPPPAPSLVAPPARQPGPAASLAKGEALIREGRIVEARSILAAPSLESVPAVTMALAETYDPNMLAAWNTLDVEPDVARARQLYQRAAEGGIAAAAKRLAALR
ncbi:MAG: hypothetical protein RLZ98_800 [Pseudomonadota bacterium]|jgi:TPR repeat protein